MRFRNLPKPLDPPQFFTDHGLGKSVVDGLRADGWTVRAMSEEWPSSQRSKRERFKDHNWITQVTEWGYVVLAKDGFRLPHERAAITRSAARVFQLSSADLRDHEMISRFITHKDAILRHCKDGGPCLYSVQPTGLVLQRLPKHG